MHNLACSEPPHTRTMLTLIMYFTKLYLKAGEGGCEMLLLQECDWAKHVFSFARALSTTFFTTIIALTGREGGRTCKWFFNLSYTTRVLAKRTC
jgi:hypothetical protein